MLTVFDNVPKMHVVPIREKLRLILTNYDLFPIRVQGDAAFRLGDASSRVDNRRPIHEDKELLSRHYI